VAAILDDLPASELEFHFKGGRLCLDLVATVGERWRRSFERLREPGDLGHWLVQSGLHAHAPTVSAADLEQARALREAIDRLARPPRGADQADVALVNRWAAEPALAPQLAPGGRALGPPAGDPVRGALAAVARDAVDLLAGPLADRIRECAADDCALLFVDASRPGRRRWCSMEACGNRAKAAAFRRRGTR
jgi:predicted RNA-binding Zn ribbon-like protein